MTFRSSFTLLALLAMSHSVQAMTLNRETSLADGRGGQMVAVTTGELAAGSASRTTDASFSNFQPREDGARVDGTLRREFSREGRSTESVLSGQLTLTPGTAASNGEPRVLKITALSVLRDGDGPQLSGTVEIDGTVVEAERLPPAIRRLLRRLVGLTQL